MRSTSIGRTWFRFGIDHNCRLIGISRQIAALLLSVWFLIGHQPSRLAWGEEPRSEHQNVARHSQDTEVPVRLLEISIGQSEQQLGDLERRIPRLQKGIESLLKQARALHSLKKEPGNSQPPGSEKRVREEQFRLPREELTEQKAIGFVCENNRVSQIDFTACNERMQAVVKRVLANAGKEEKFKFDNIPDSDFGFEGSVKISPGKGLDLNCRVVRMPGRLGETLEEIRRPQSRFQRVLLAHKGKEKGYYISFAVWPDSYETFRQARFLVWEAGFDVGWSPMTTGEKVELGSGPGVKGT